LSTDSPIDPQSLALLETANRAVGLPAEDAIHSKAQIQDLVQGLLSPANVGWASATDFTLPIAF